MRRVDHKAYIEGARRYPASVMVAVVLTTYMISGCAEPSNTVNQTGSLPGEGGAATDVYIAGGAESFTDIALGVYGHAEALGWLLEANSAYVWDLIPANREMVVGVGEPISVLEEGETFGAFVNRSGTVGVWAQIAINSGVADEKLPAGTPVALFDDNGLFDELRELDLDIDPEFLESF